MLNANKLAGINGHETHISYSKSTLLKRAWCTCDCDGGKQTPLSSGWYRKEEDALVMLRDLVLKEHGRIVMERAGWKCQDCMGVKALQAHHDTFRSHGRSDQVTNLIALCQPCHEKRHESVRRADGE